MLEENGLVSRDYKPTIPPSVYYALTPRGMELKDVLDGLGQLALRWHEEDARVEA